MLLLLSEGTANECQLTRKTKQDNQGPAASSSLLSRSSAFWSCSSALFAAERPRTAPGRRPGEPTPRPWSN